MLEQHPEILIVGSGAMGALFGAILFANGRNVVLYDTAHEHFPSLQAHSLQITGSG